MQGVNSRLHDLQDRCSCTMLPLIVDELRESSSVEGADPMGERSERKVVVVRDRKVITGGAVIGCVRSSASFLE